MENNELILLAKSGNEQALETLVKRHLSLVYGSCLRFMGNQDDAEDAVQETFVKVWRNLKKTDPEKNFKAWILEIAKNTCLDFLKKKRAVPMSAFEDENGFNYLAESLVSTDRSPADAAEQSILSRVLNSALEKLSPAYRNVGRSNRIQPQKCVPTLRPTIRVGHALSTKSYPPWRFTQELLPND